MTKDTRSSASTLDKEDISARLKTDMAEFDGITRSGMELFSISGDDDREATALFDKATALGNAIVLLVLSLQPRDRELEAHIFTFNTRIPNSAVEDAGEELGKLPTALDEQSTLQMIDNMLILREEYFTRMCSLLRSNS